MENRKKWKNKYYKERRQSKEYKTENEKLKDILIEMIRDQVIKKINEEDIDEIKGQELLEVLKGEKE